MILTNAMPLRLLTLIALVALAGCNKSKETSNESEPTKPIQARPLNFQASDQATIFTMLPASETGLDFENLLLRENHRPFIENGAGVAVGDYDDDGLVDIYLISTDGANRLYRQTAPFKFEDVTEAAGVQSEDAWGAGAAFADVDNDGDLDLYVANNGSRDHLFINRGNGKFFDKSRSSRIDYEGSSRMGCFCDYDRDGDLDLYILTYSVKPTEGQATIQLVNGEPTVHPDYLGKYEVIDGHIVVAGEKDFLFQNNGDGTFRDVSEEAGISGYDLGLSATWFDYNNDGWTDLYVANDFKTPDRLYRNNGDGTFTNVIAETVQHTPWFSMGADFGDINNDGWFDFFLADMSGTTHYKQKTMMGSMGESAWFLVTGAPRQYMRNALYINTGTEHWMESAYMSDLDSTDWTWAVNLRDLDNDGLQDVFVTTGHARNTNDSDMENTIKRLGEEKKFDEQKELSLNIPPLNEINRAYRNVGDLKFEPIEKEWGLDLNGVSHGAAFADFDNDGDLDIVVSNLNSPVSIYRNDSGQGNRLVVQLNGTQSNRFGVGAIVEIETEAGIQKQQLIPARGFCASHEPIAHFGLGEQDKILGLRVIWPSGVEQVFQDLDANQRYEITEPDSQPVSTGDTEPESSKVRPLFAESAESLGLDFKHSELYYDDYVKEPLLPYQLSQLGPGIAWGDVNGDGRDDCYVGGARGQVARLYILQEDGKFQSQNGPWRDDFSSEDLGALFIDYDSDGDMDLFVVSGGNEAEPDHESYRNRLYQNDGEGNFERVEQEALESIRTSGSCVTACDFDRDGDLDLFLGGRMVPGLYPLTPDSHVLRNDDGNFVDATDEVAEGLKTIGLVNSAVWSDVDNDGWTDLMVVLDWGPVCLFKNESGTLVNRTAEAGTAMHLGWWHGIAAGDFDEDGDIDFVVTNQGLNTKYHTDAAHPHRLYYSDFDNSGTLDLVESEYENGVEVPMRGRSCSSHCMPMIADKFPTYHEFALAPLGDIYGNDNLKKGESKEVTILESVTLVNDGSGTFEVRKLPTLAQISPGFGAEMADLDGDGHLDMVIAQNFFAPQPETGYMDGGLSLMLRGDGTGNFEPVWPMESGIGIPVDANALAVTDYNQDNRLDLAFTINDRNVQFFVNQNSTPLHKVTLSGSAGNPNAIGARVTVTTSQDRQIVREVRAGGSYLSQSSSAPYIGLGPGESIQSVEVRWPDGSTTNHGDLEQTIEQ